MSAVTRRERRKTAGQRMTALVGKALEEDNTFWGHDTWGDDGDSGNESFRDSDEDSEMKKDQFDSDFDDSESDHEDEEAAAGMEAEAQLQKSERSTKQRKSNYVDIAKAGRDLMQKRKGKGKKRIMGDGINAGIVLNFPGDMPALPAAASNLQVAVRPLPPPLLPVNSQPATKRQPKLKAEAAALSAVPVAVSSRRRRSLYSPRKLRETRSTAPSDAILHPKSTSVTSNKKMKRKRYAQEELLLEAINDTEPENGRWLLARKRIRDLVEKDKDALLRDTATGKIVEKYNSRRGCLNTLTFPEMDAVPEILTRPRVDLALPSPTLCVITGKPAKYRDPLTKLGYFDMASFKEIRRRHKAGEQIIPPKTMKQPPVKFQLEPETEALSAKSPVSSGPNISNRTKMKPAEPQRDSELTVDLSKIKSANKREMEIEAEATAGILSADDKPTSSKAMSLSRGGRSGSPIRSASTKQFSKVQPDPSSPVTRCGKPGNKATNIDFPEKPPLSPGRRSRRRWKPSSKLLQNIANEDRNNAATAGALAIRMESDGLTWCRSSVAGNELKDSLNASALEDEQSMMKGAQPAANGTRADSSTQKADTSKASYDTRQDSGLSKSSPKPATNPGCVPSNHLTNKSDTETSAAGGRSGIKRRNKIDNASRKQAPEPVYMVSNEAEASENQKSEKKKEGEPRYITQSELIMEAIQTYSKQRERSLSQSDN